MIKKEWLEILIAAKEGKITIDELNEIILSDYYTNTVYYSAGLKPLAKENLFKEKDILDIMISSLKNNIASTKIKRTVKQLILKHKIT